MIKITVCIGSSCHLKGARQVVEKFQSLIAENGLSEKVTLSGAFCMGKCSENGVSVTVNGEYFAISPEKTEELFYKEVATRS